MRTKSQSSVNLKVIFLGFSILIFIKTEANISQEEKETQHKLEVCRPTTPVTPQWSKMPVSVSDALVHYVTSNITPQQTFDEISVSKRVLDKKSPCNFLVFGLGNDSLMWTSLNHGGRTVFIEEYEDWIAVVSKIVPNLESYFVAYDTKLKDSDKLMKLGRSEECKSVSDPRNSTCDLALKDFPSDFYETKWDLIMIDAPTGYHDEAPGRMKAIYTAGLLARNRDVGETDIFVHDVDRPVEDEFSSTFLCKEYMKEENGRLRHFTIPSHRELAGRPFCPVVV